MPLYKQENAAIACYTGDLRTVIFKLECIWDIEGMRDEERAPKRSFISSSENRSGSSTFRICLLRIAFQHSSQTSSMLSVILPHTRHLR
jgi:hypothetical protein